MLLTESLLNKVGDFFKRAKPQSEAGAMDLFEWLPSTVGISGCLLEKLTDSLGFPQLNLAKRVAIAAVIVVAGHWAVSTGQQGLAKAVRLLLHLRRLLAPTK